jgi:Flp pilus assembly protein TadG
MSAEGQISWRPAQAKRRALGYMRARMSRKGRPVDSDDRKDNFATGEDGSSLVEFALTLTALFTLLFCFMELCLVFYSYDLISELARQGTRYAMVRSGTCLTSGNSSCTASATQVNTFVTSIGLPNLARGSIVAATSYCPPASTTCTSTNTVGQVVQVKVTYAFPITMHFVPKDSLTLTSISRMTIVQ